MVKDDGKIKTLKKKKEKYRSNIDVKNWRKFFQGDRTIVRDDAKFVESEIEKAENYRKDNADTANTAGLELYNNTKGNLKKLKAALSKSELKYEF